MSALGSTLNRSVIAIGLVILKSRLRWFSNGQGLFTGANGIGLTTPPNARIWASVKTPALTNAWPAGVSLPAKLLLKAEMSRLSWLKLLIFWQRWPSWVLGSICHCGVV